MAAAFQALSQLWQRRLPVTVVDDGAAIAAQDSRCERGHGQPIIVSI